jgi:hypothetical protein
MGNLNKKRDVGNAVVLLHILMRKGMVESGMIAIADVKQKQTKTKEK